MVLLPPHHPNRLESKDSPFRLWETLPLSIDTSSLLFSCKIRREDVIRKVKPGFCRTTNPLSPRDFHLNTTKRENFPLSVDM